VLEFLKSKICVKTIMICKRTMDQKKTVYFFIEKAWLILYYLFARKKDCVLKV